MNDVHETYDRLEETYLEITKQYLQVNETTIDQRLFQHTGIYAFFGAVLAYAKQKMDEASNDLDREEATTREFRRSELLEEGKKATDRALDGYVKTVLSVQKSQAKHRASAHSYHLAKNIINSLDHQKDMLVQISANKRAESKLINDSFGG